MSSSTLTMRSRKQLIRLWFECLQICHTQSSYSENLKSSNDFYSDWGDVTSIKFDEWWKKKKYLFEDAIVTEVSKVSKRPNTITLSIPLDESVSTTLKEVKRIVENQQMRRLQELGLNHLDLKSKKLSLGKFTFSQKEVKGKFHYINLEIYKIFLEQNRPPINRDFLMCVRKKFDERYRSKLSKNIIWIPCLEDFLNTFTSNKDCEDIIRTVRRGIKNIELTLENVSKGKFP